MYQNAGYACYVGHNPVDDWMWGDSARCQAAAWIQNWMEDPRKERELARRWRLAAAREEAILILTKLETLAGGIRDVLQVSPTVYAREFLDRFAGDDEAECDFLLEVTLKLAMAQSLTAESDLHRGWVWHAVSYDDLRSPLPTPFKSAWEFYKAVDNRDLNDHYEVLLDDKKVASGRVRREAPQPPRSRIQQFEGLTVPEKTADGRPHPFKVLRDTPGFLGKLKKLGKVTDIPDVAEPKPAPAKKKARKGKKAPTSKPNVESDGEYEPPVEAPAPKTPTAASEAEEEDEDSEESTDPEDRFPPAPVMSAKRAGKQRAATPVDSAGEEEAEVDAAGEDDDMAPSTWGMPPPPFDGAAS
ncbi:hypothetical protein R3P38DRAFT_2788235 [Favolaschia claudopus]|uniref:Uncharacterized protein n=1 Tax=Favolaschia claudopus TaxID=2862362 RepID=A0AAW0ALN0_9AGAR